MNTSKLTAIIVSIIGAEFVSKAQREQIKALLDTIVSATVKVKGATNEPKTVVEEPNTLKDESNTISLQDATYFRLPHDINVEIEGEGEPRKIKIFPDGVSENVNYGNAN
jgi:hypothetical protein